MNKFTVTTVDEIIDTLKSGKILSADVEYGGAVGRINSYIDTNREYAYYG